MNGNNCVYLLMYLNLLSETKTEICLFHYNFTENFSPV